MKIDSGLSLCEDIHVTLGRREGSIDNIVIIRQDIVPPKQSGQGIILTKKALPKLIENLTKLLTKD